MTTKTREGRDISNIVGRTVESVELQADGYLWIWFDDGTAVQTDHYFDDEGMYFDVSAL